MRQREVARLMGMLNGLTRGQRKMLAAELSEREATCSSIELVEKDTPAQSACPHYASRQVVRNGSSDGLQRYKFHGSVRRGVEFEVQRLMTWGIRCAKN